MKDKFNQLYSKLTKKYGKQEVKAGLDIEKEHDDITKGDKVKRLKIAAAHLKEKPNYYQLLKKHVEK